MERLVLAKGLCIFMPLLFHSTAADPPPKDARKEIRFEALCPQPHVEVMVGRNATLASQLSPSINAEHMNISVYLTRYKSPGSSKKDVSSSVDLWRRHLHQGLLHVRISHVGLEDEGIYTVYFRSRSFHSSCVITLTLAGSAPHMTAKGIQDGVLDLVCSASSSSPLWEVWWEDDEGKNRTTSILPDHSDLYNVTAITRIHEPGNFHCIQRNQRSPKIKVSTLSIEESVLQTCSCWKRIAGTLVGSMALAIVGSLIFHYTCQKRKCKEVNPKGVYDGIKLLQGQKDAEIQNLKNQIDDQSAELEWYRQHSEPANFTQVDVLLDAVTTCPSLQLSSDRRSVRLRGNRQAVAAPSSEWPVILGSQGFTVGKYCWLVDVGTCQSWAVGIAVASVSRMESSSLVPEEGVWAVGLTAGQHQAFTCPVTKLSMDSPLKKLVVYLDLKARQLSFYNAATCLPIFSYMCQFTEKVFPFTWTMDLENFITYCPPADMNASPKVHEAPESNKPT